MNNHPLNLGLRFLLEIAALAATIVWANQYFQGYFKWVVMISLPIFIGVIWAVFRVDGDPGKAPVAIKGWLRLIIEFLIFGIAVWMYYKTGYSKIAITMLILLIMHYLVSYDRVLKLLGQ